MSRIHPSNHRGAGDHGRTVSSSSTATAPELQVYTVWKRSSMGFQGTDGFSVYDAGGRLAFRVDNYGRRCKAFAGEILLMDGRGSPLLSLRPQILSLHDRWNCYRVADAPVESAEGGCPAPEKKLFSMRRCSALHSSDEAEVYMSSSSPSSPESSSSGRRGCRSPPPPSFRIEGSFSRRSCKITGSDGQEAARISRKKAGPTSPATVATLRPVSLGDDVFSLVVRPGVDAATVMAMVVVLDRICRRPYTPMACSSRQ